MTGAGKGWSTGGTRKAFLHVIKLSGILRVDSFPEVPVGLGLVLMGIRGSGSNMYLIPVIFKCGIKMV